MFALIDVKDAQERFDYLLERVRGGESFTITYRGELIADITPRKKTDKARLRAAIEYLSTSSKPTVSDEDTKVMISEGRAD